MIFYIILKTILSMTRIEWASSQIKKKAKYKKAGQREQKEFDTNLSQLVSTVLAWTQ
jgi:hypothetical protein